MAVTVAQVLTQNGRTYTASQMAGTTTTAPKFIGVGTGATTPGRGAVISDTALTTEAFLNGGGVRVGTATPTNTANVYSIVQTIVNNSGSLSTVDEAGVFTTSTGGIMVLSATFNGVPLNANDSIQITANITYS